ncbi:uncharacterized protein LOC133012211 [Limanda limanda]|uniref:uncharacterized protein LOC133012211 n=1 Tax=Limanda limanda TaxID=27771 RepID=UPI0029C95A4B|nr:uncharacterized protein LOC133012211 [Limanda limanda]
MTPEKDPQTPSFFKNQGPDEPVLHIPMQKVGMKSSLVVYTDSDISHSPSKNSDSDSEFSLSKRNRDSIPRLGKTKSVQMNNQIQFDSDETLAFTTDGSEEEYIPDTSQDSSDGTDTTEAFDPGDQRNIMPSLTELNNCSTKLRKRGRSPSRTGSGTGERPKKQAVTRGRDTGDLFETSTADLEQNIPDSSSSQHDGLAEGSLSIHAVCKKDNGSRMYNKKYYCLYCKMGVGKMARHLERAHINMPEVALAVSFPKGSKERRMHLEHLRNRGNFAHNVEVLNAGVGDLVPRKQPKQDSEALKFLHCTYCQGFFAKKLLWRHMMICKFKPAVSKKPGKTRVQALCAFSIPPPPGVKVEFWKLLSNMIQDEVYSAVKSDVCIMEYGEHLYNRLGFGVCKHEYIRQKLRELGRLLQ